MKRFAANGSYARSLMKIELLYALPEEQDLLSLSVEPSTTVEQAILASGILQRYPEIDLTKNPVGIFSKLVDLQHKLRDGDRIEIYRPLIIDPKEARRLRAKS